MMYAVWHVWTTTSSGCGSGYWFGSGISSGHGVLLEHTYIRGGAADPDVSSSGTTTAAAPETSLRLAGAAEGLSVLAVGRAKEVLTRRAAARVSRKQVVVGGDGSGDKGSGGGGGEDSGACGESGGGDSEGGGGDGSGDQGRGGGGGEGAGEYGEGGGVVAGAPTVIAIVTRHRETRGGAAPAAARARVRTAREAVWRRGIGRNGRLRGRGRRR